MKEKKTIREKIKKKRKQKYFSISPKGNTLEEYANLKKANTGWCNR